MADDIAKRRGLSTVGSALAEYQAAAVAADLPVIGGDEAWWEEREAIVAAQQPAQVATTQTIRARDVILEAAGFPARAVLEAREHAGQGPIMARVAKLEPAGARSKRGILVVGGNVGNGKTTAATWWAMERGGGRPCFITGHGLATTSRYDDDKPWRGCTSLVLDDLAAEYSDAKGSFLADLADLIDLVYRNLIPTIITTNLVASDFMERYGSKEGRIASRLRGGGSYWHATEADKRR